MEKKGMTKKQLRVQLISPVMNIVLGTMWLVEGIRTGKTALWLFGILFIALAVGMIVSLVITRKRHPIEDAEIDKQATEGLKAGGIVLGILAVCFLFAFGLAAILK